MSQILTEPFIPFNAPYAGDDDRLIRQFAARTSFTSAQDAAIDQRARRMINAIRDGSGKVGGVEDFCANTGFRRAKGWR